MSTSTAGSWLAVRFVSRAFDPAGLVQVPGYHRPRQALAEEGHVVDEHLGEVRGDEPDDAAGYQVFDGVAGLFPAPGDHGEHAGGEECQDEGGVDDGGGPAGECLELGQAGVVGGDEQDAVEDGEDVSQAGQHLPGQPGDGPVEDRTHEGIHGQPPTMPLTTDSSTGASSARP